MQVNSVNGTGSEGGVSQGGGMDAYSKGIMKEIENIRQQMQELSQNDSMSMEEKMKKKQQMQQRINELNNELRKHQIELRKQKQESGAVKNDMSPEPAENSSKGNAKGTSDNLSAGNLQAIISADASMEISKAGRRAADGLKATAKVLKGEIKADGGRGNMEAKQKQLQEVEERAEHATASQIKQMTETVHDMRQTASLSEETGKEERGEDQRAATDEMEEQQSRPLRKVDVLL